MTAPIVGATHASPSHALPKEAPAMTAEVEAAHNSPFVAYQLPGPGPSRQPITNSMEER